MGSGIHNLNVSILCNIIDSISLSKCPHHRCLMRMYLLVNQAEISALECLSASPACRKRPPQRHNLIGWKIVVWRLRQELRSAFEMPLPHNCARRNVAISITNNVGETTARDARQLRASYLLCVSGSQDQMSSTTITGRGTSFELSTGPERSMRALSSTRSAVYRHRAQDETDSRSTKARP